MDLSHSSSDGSDKDGQVKEHAWEEKRQHNEERHRLTGLGYFVFPPGGWNVAEERPQNEENSPRKGLDNLDRSEKDRQAKEHAWEERLRRSEEARSKLLEQVQEEGRKGEIEWVR